MRKVRELSQFRCFKVLTKVRNSWLVAYQEAFSLELYIDEYAFL